MAALIGDIKETLTGIEGEKAWHRAFGRHPLPRRKRSLSWIDEEHTHTVMSAIGHVDVTPVAADGDLGASAISGEAVRAGGDGLQRCEAWSRFAIGGDRRIQFVDDVCEQFSRMEVDM